MSSIRKQYRVELQATNAVEGVFKHSYRSSLCVTGRITDLSASGAGLGLSGSDLECLSVGDLGTLEVRAPWLQSALSVNVEVRNKRMDLKPQRVGLRFTVPEQVDRSITPMLHSIFNRRNAPRVQPHEGEVIEARVEALDATAAGGGLVGQLAQVSASGLQINVPRHDAVPFLPGAKVRLAMVLSQRSIQVAATYRSQREVGRERAMGFEFDSAATADFERTQGVILGFVLGRLKAPRLRSSG